MKRDRTYRAVWILAATIVLATVSVAHAATTYYWIDSSDDWTNTADWSPSTAYPVSGDTAYIGNGGTVAVSGTDACANLYVGSDQSTAQGAGTLNIGAGFTATSAYIGTATNGGIVTQTAGAATITTFTFGGATSGWAGGTYNLNGGTLNVGSITFGTYGANAFNLGGGMLQWSSAITCSAPMALSSATTSAIDVQGNAVTMSGALTGGGSLSVGTGTTTGALNLSSASSTYSGGTTLNGGVLRIGANSSGMPAAPPLAPWARAPWCSAAAPLQPTAIRIGLSIMPLLWMATWPSAAAAATTMA